MSENLAYLGVSPIFPIQLLNGGALALTAGVDNVIQGITDILDTPKGSRFFLRNYGSRLYKLLYEPNDDILKGLLREVVKEAVQTWEGRAEFSDLEIDFSKKDSGVLELLIFVRVRSINETISFIYPFYTKLNY